MGLDLWTRAYSVAEPQRDAAHARLLERLRSRLPVGLDWWTEVPFPNAGDLRSWDGMVRPQGLRVAVEAETRPGDGQELQRRMARKRRDGEVDRLILLLADTRWNCLLVREYQGQWAADFPVPGRRALRALERGLDPGGDAIILL